MNLLEQVPRSENERLAAELFDVTNQRLALEKREFELKNHFKTGMGAATGARIYGAYAVIVSSNSKTVMDQEAVRALLGPKTPTKFQLQVQCSVKKL